MATDADPISTLMGVQADLLIPNTQVVISLRSIRSGGNQDLIEVESSAQPLDARKRNFWVQRLSDGHFSGHAMFKGLIEFSRSDGGQRALTPAGAQSLQDSGPEALWPLARYTKSLTNRDGTEVGFVVMQPRAHMADQNAYAVQFTFVGDGAILDHFPATIEENQDGEFSVQKALGYVSQVFTYGDNPAFGIRCSPALIDFVRANDEAAAHSFITGAAPGTQIAL